MQAAAFLSDVAGQRGAGQGAAHNRGDLDALVELYDPEAVFETLLLGTHHGNEAIRLI